MKIRINNSIRAIIACSVIVFSAALSWGSSTSVDRASHHKIAIHDTEIDPNAPMTKILPVLESKIGDQKLIEKAKAKLSTFDNAEIRLIASLCTRISCETNTPGADFAFLLVTVLIVLS